MSSASLQTPTDRASCSNPAVLGPVYSSLFSVYFIDGGGARHRPTHAHNLRYVHDVRRGLCTLVLSFIVNLRGHIESI